MPTASNPIEIACRYCGGTSIMRDAWAVWDVERQDWVLGPVFDHAHCDDCDGETGLIERPLAPAHP